jgi:uncharacterized membrane protein YkvA (DUF1232 family)
MQITEIVDIESGALTEICGQELPLANSDGARNEPASAMNWRQQAGRLQKEAHVFYYAFKHPLTPWYAKLVAVCTAGYLVSPIQLIPSFIPVIGFLDDFLVLFLGAKLLQRIIPAGVLAESRQFAEVAETRRKAEITSSARTVAALAIAAVWLLLAAAAGGLIASHISP